VWWRGREGTWVVVGVAGMVAGVVIGMVRAGKRGVVVGVVVVVVREGKQALWWW
jgi:hypothetical protein